MYGNYFDVCFYFHRFFYGFVFTLSIGKKRHEGRARVEKGQQLTLDPLLKNISNLLEIINGCFIK